MEYLVLINCGWTSHKYNVKSTFEGDSGLVTEDKIIFSSNDKAEFLAFLETLG